MFWGQKYSCVSVQIPCGAEGNVCVHTHVSRVETSVELKKTGGKREIPFISLKYFIFLLSNKATCVALNIPLKKNPTTYKLS